MERGRGKSAGVLEKERGKRERGRKTYNETIKDLRVERERERDGKRARR